MSGSADLQRQRRRAQVAGEALHQWCARWLDAAPEQVLFETGNLSYVAGLRLTDGRAVVVKARPPTGRLRACDQVQRHLWAAGFPCPQPLAGPARLGPFAATAEMLVPGGEQLEPAADSAQRFAEALARLVARAPSPTSLPTLAPAPAWVRWDHAEPGTWPRTASDGADLNMCPGPAWLEDVARRARRRLGQCQQPSVVGHMDWESQNLRWVGRRLHVAHDWDSVAARPEAAIAGAAAAVFPTPGKAAGAATLEESEAFLSAYAAARGRPWSREEWQVGWAAGTWVLAYNARVEVQDGSGGPVLRHLVQTAAERLARAGA